jgi:hypothetical protein
VSEVVHSYFSLFIIFIVLMKLHISRKISFADSINDGENSPTKLFNSPGAGMTPLILQKYSNYQFQYLNLAQILSKPRSQRTHTENRFIT